MGTHKNIITQYTVQLARDALLFIICCIINN